jgi:hypothetical protein
VAAPVVRRCPAIGPLWELLTAALEHRFDGEVRLGQDWGPGWAVAEDIAIATGEDA